MRFSKSQIAAGDSLELPREIYIDDMIKWR